MSSVTPVILPSLAPGYEVSKPFNPVGAGLCTVSISHVVVTASVEPSSHLPVFDVTFTVYVPASFALLPSIFIITKS